MLARPAPWLAALLLLACADEPEAPVCELCRTPVAALSGAAGTYLVARVEMRPAVGSTVDGLDVDGVVTDRSAMRATDCVGTHDDQIARYDARVVGVDNTGQSLVAYGEAAYGDGSTFQGAFDDALADGRIRWAVEVGEPVALDEDRWEMPLTFHRIDEAETIALDGAAPAAGQTLRSIPLGTVTATVLGSSAMGLFAAPVEDVHVVDDDVLLLPFDAFRLDGLALDVGTTGSPELVLGGSVTVDGLVALFVEVFMSSPGDESIVRQVFEAVADLEPDAADPLTCRRVSVGLRAALVPVTLTSG